MFGSQNKSGFTFGSGTATSGSGQTSSLFGGSQNTAAAGTGSSLFGSSAGQNQGSGGSLFGGASNSQPSLFGNTNAGLQVQPHQQQQQQQSLFGSTQSNPRQSTQPSLFSNSTNQNSNSFMSSQNGTAPSLFNSSVGGGQVMSPTVNQSLSHSQSLMDLSRSRYEPETPQWGRTERRYVPNHMDALRTKSSFSTPDRAGASSSLRASVVDRQAKALTDCT
jgi:hypothetical protein